MVSIIAREKRSSAETAPLTVSPKGEQGLAEGKIPRTTVAFRFRVAVFRFADMRHLSWILTPQRVYPKTKSGPHFSFAKPWGAAVAVEGIAVEDLAPLKKTSLNCRHASLLADYLPVGDDCGDLIIDNRASLRL